MARSLAPTANARRSRWRRDTRIGVSDGARSDRRDRRGRGDRRASFLPTARQPAATPLAVHVPRAGRSSRLVLFLLLLFGLPLARRGVPSRALEYSTAFYRSGALVFGGGHVVLPLLQAEVVPPGWVTNDAFLAGYGAAQAVPGPLFTFAAYLGTVMAPPLNGLAGGCCASPRSSCRPSCCWSVRCPIWDMLRRLPRAGRAARDQRCGGRPAARGAVPAGMDQRDFRRRPISRSALVAFLLLALWAVPPWLVVILGAVAASAVAML